MPAGENGIEQDKYSTYSHRSHTHVQVVRIDFGGSTGPDKPVVKEDRYLADRHLSRGKDQCHYQVLPGVAVRLGYGYLRSREDHGLAWDEGHPQLYRLASRGTKTKLVSISDAPRFSSMKDRADAVYAIVSVPLNTTKAS